MTTTAAQRTVIVPPAPPLTPRARLVATRMGRAVLDGGWWPRSSDPLAELPGLILALNDRYGPIRQLMLNSHAWDRRFRRLRVGSRVVRVGWFATLDPALAIAITDGEDQLDLLVVPPGTAEPAACSAMARAADPANTLRAPGILAALPITPAPALGDDTDPISAWENEGGHLLEHRPHRAVNRHPVATSDRGAVMSASPANHFDPAGVPRP